ncbi:MAG TPA: glycosyltransferase family 1 protein [Bryobacteraceae bacterium]|nr:glycosyltransferase family 1 protein [Bryobacteraceae bacterium]
MIVTIDATSALLRSAGIKNYTYHWVRHLRAQAGGDEIRAFPYLKDFGKLDHENSTLSRWQTIPRLVLLYLTRDSTFLDWMMGGTDIFHASNQVRRKPRGVKLTATIHDLTCWLMPELHTRGNILADQTWAHRVLRRADRLIAVSENTRQDAIRLLDIPPDRIQTIYSGIAQEYFDAPPTERQRPYALYVGTIEPRKNIDKLLDAWKALRADLRDRFELVIAGPQGWGSQATMQRVRAESTYLGYVPEADLPGLIAGASVFVYPSLYEGFGFPVAQALAARAPVLTSNNSSLREIAAGVAQLVDPQSSSEIAGGLTRLLESESLRGDLARRGRQRAENFRWETCAAQSLDFFRGVLGSSG